MQEAMLYDRLDDNRVRCNLCAHRCLIHDGKVGVCQVRENRGGTLHTLVYGRTISQAVDPVEKKPLFHFYPGSTALSIATPGCNFRCLFCQNADISQMPREQHRIMGYRATPEELAAAAKRYDSRSMAYTYTEPTIFTEYALDTGRVAHRLGIANIYVTNGYMTTEMLDLWREDGELLLDAANVELKSFRDELYKRQCGARLQPVLDSLRKMKAMGVWVEVTTLIIPTLNDGDDELRELAGFIASELGPETPWHVSRFHPTYKLTDKPITPAATLQRARDIGLGVGLRYVYVGNLPGSEGESTFCYNCGRLVLGRFGYCIMERHITGGQCDHCGATIDGVGM